MSTAKQNIADPYTPETDNKPVIGRLLSYLLRHPIRLSLGFFLALFVSISNLFLLGSLVSIIDIIGSNPSQPVKIFVLSEEERKLLTATVEKGEELPAWQAIQKNLVHFKHNTNQKFSNYSAKKAVLVICLIVFPVHLLRIIALVATIYFLGTVGLFAVRHIRLEMYKNIQALGMHFFNREKTGTLMSRVINDGEVIGRLLSVQFSEVLVDFFYIITHIGFLFWLSWETTLFVFILAPILLVPVNSFARRIQKAAMGQQERLADLIGNIQETISGIRVIRAFGMEKIEYRKFRMITQQLYQNTFLGHYYHQVGPVLTETISSVLILSFFVWGAFQMSQGEMSQGHFFAFFFVIIFILRPIKKISISINLASAARSAAARMFVILDEKIDVKNPKPNQTREIGEFRHAISYENVSFYYPNSQQETLKNISFTVACNESLSIVGPSGAGKSTLIDLLARLYDPSNGRISIDGVCIQQFRLHDLRTLIGLVSQDVFLFHATIAENIAYGCKDTSLEKIIEVAQHANADDFINKLPNGYDTLVGERGVMLSGGQGQRIAIARTLLRNPPILVLDEATSNLDNESEYLIKQALERLSQGRTVITIAHRLSTTRHAKNILVLDQGCIVEQGDHQALLAKKGMYYQLFEKQKA